MVISPAILDELIAHARQDAPNECCGVIAAAGRQATRLYRMANLKASPLAFEVDGRQLLRISTEIEDAGWELGAIYHSHTRTAPYPSQTDINFAAHWPGVEWVIVGLATPGDPEIRSYLIEDGQVSEVPVAGAAGVDAVGAGGAGGDAGVEGDAGVREDVGVGEAAA